MDGQDRQDADRVCTRTLTLTRSLSLDGSGSGIATLESR